MIYIAGIVSIPREYYEAAEVDGASRVATSFRHITLPLARPATATVIILSLIGGLRSFDLIWAMTGGGPGFTSDVIASVIYKQYQAGFYGLSTAGNVVLFLLVTVIIVPLYLVAQPKEVELMKNTRGVVIGGRRHRRVAVIFFLVPFAFIFLIAVKDADEAGPAPVLLADQLVLFWTTSRQVVSARDYMLVIAFINSTILTVVSVAAPGRPRRDGRLRLQRRPGPTGAGRQRPGAGRADHPARRRADHLGAAEAGPVQDAARPDPDRDRLRAVVLHPAVPGLHRGHPARARRGGDRRRRRPVRLFFRVIFPLLRSVMMTVIIVQSVAIFNDFATRSTSCPATRTPPCS